MDPLLAPIVHIYADEVRDQLQRIGDELLAMEADPRVIATHIEELYRQAHSLKGASGSLGLEEMEQLAHQLEEALLDVRRGLQPLTPPLVDAVLHALDAARMRTEGLVADD